MDAILLAAERGSRFADLRLSGSDEARINEVVDKLLDAGKHRFSDNDYLNYELMLKGRGRDILKMLADFRQQSSFNHRRFKELEGELIESLVTSAETFSASRVEFAHAKEEVKREWAVIREGIAHPQKPLLQRGVKKVGSLWEAMGEAAAKTPLLPVRRKVPGMLYFQQSGKLSEGLRSESAVSRVPILSQSSVLYPLIEAFAGTEWPTDKIAKGVRRVLEAHKQELDLGPHSMESVVVDCTHLLQDLAEPIWDPPFKDGRPTQACLRRAGDAASIAEYTRARFEAEGRIKPQSNEEKDSWVESLNGEARDFCRSNGIYTQDADGVRREAKEVVIFSPVAPGHILSQSTRARHAQTLWLRASNIRSSAFETDSVAKLVWRDQSEDGSMLEVDAINPDPTGMFRILAAAMSGINVVATPIKVVEGLVGAAVAAGCDTRATAPVCRTVGRAAGYVGKAAAYVVPDVLIQGVENTVLYLERNGIPRATTAETGRSLLSLSWVAPLPFMMRRPRVTVGEVVAEVSADHAEVTSREVARLEATHRARVRYEQGLDMEKMRIARLRSYTGSTQLPQGFPRHLHQFYSQCETHSFRRTKLGARGNGILEGHLLYKPFENNALFVVQLNSQQRVVMEKIGPHRLIRSTGLYWDKRLGCMVDEVMKLAQEKGFERVYLAWNPSALPLATTLASRSHPILSVNSLSTGIHSPPLPVVEIAVPKK
jgi:hypothetical protein